MSSIAFFASSKRLGGASPAPHTVCWANRSLAPRTGLCLRLSAFFLLLVCCLVAQQGSAVQQRVLSSAIQPPSQLGLNASRNASAQRATSALKLNAQDAGQLASRVCVPQVDGWDHVRGASLHGIGYHAAAVPLGRYILVLGGVENLPALVDAATYVSQHTQRGMNLFNPAESRMEGLQGLQHNTSSDTGQGAVTSFVASASALPVPVVGTGSVVRVHNRVYAFGACNTIPESVRLDQLRSKAPSTADTDGSEEGPSTTSSPDVQVVENYLRSVLQIQVQLEANGHSGPFVINRVVSYQPASLRLRYNATCVAGAHGVVYIIGGVDARTGETLASVAAYDTETGTFVDGAWSLDQPVSTPAATSDSTLVFLSGGFSQVPDPTLFNPSRRRRDYHTHIDVLDTRRNFFARDVARYASPEDAEDTLQWTAPQVFVRGTSMLLLGNGGKKPYGRVAYWANLSQAPSSSPTPVSTGGKDDEGTQTRDAPQQLHAAQESVRSTRVLPFADFTLVPARRDGVVAMVPAEDGGSVTLYLFGGRLTASPLGAADVHRTGGGGGGVAGAAVADIFKARVQLCVAEDHPQSTETSAANDRDGDGGTKSKEKGGLLPVALGFAYPRVRITPPQQEEGEEREVTRDAVSHSRTVLEGRKVASFADRDVCAPVYGYIPLLYNVSTSVLLSYKETLRACPGIKRTANSTASVSSSCALLLSSSPQCNEPLAEFTYLSASNARVVDVPRRDQNGHAQRTVKAFAVAQVFFLGSRSEGLVKVLSTGNDGREPVIGNAFGTTSPDTRGETPIVGAGAYLTLYEQSLVYVCFSRRSGVVSSCDEAVSTPRGGGGEGNVTALHGHLNSEEKVAVRTEGWPAACSTPFYEVLSPSSGGFLLSPECSCSADSGDVTPEPDWPLPTPEPKHMLRPWMLLSIIVFLLVVIVAYIIVTFVLMPSYAFSRQGGQQRNGTHNVAVVGGADPDQQRSLLPYREARVFLGVGGVGMGAGGGHGGDALAYDDVPEEYETALTAAGLNGFEARWDTGENATRRRRLLDGKYEVIRKLGKGSFSVVYLVRRITDNTIYALKYLQCSDDVDRHEAMKECEVVYALQGHPNVIQLFDMFMSYRFDRHMVTVPRSRKTREAAVEKRHATTDEAAKSRAGGAVAVEGQERSADDAERPLLLAVAGAETNPATGRGSVHLPKSPSAGVVADMEQSYDVTQNAPPERSGWNTVGEGKSGVRASVSGQDVSVTAATTSEQQSVLTPSTSNATSAETSTTSRPIVHMDSTYFDAMAAGLLQDDSSESPTTPHYPRSEQETQQQQQQQQQQQNNNNNNQEQHGQGKKVVEGAPPPHHRRGLSTLQAERYLSLVMAYHERGDLARWVRQRRALQPLIPEATVVSIAFQVLSLLSYMHHRHQPPIIHRDLKPENILLTTHVHYENVNEDFLPIVVTDFGLSRVMDKTFCETGVGSLPYVAPECWQRRYSAKVDIWSLGCVLYAVCTKRVDSNNVKVMFSECASPDFHERLQHELQNIYGYSEALGWFITSLLAVKPDDRPTASEALRMLRRQPLNERGQPRFYGPPLASQLRASSAPPMSELHAAVEVNTHTREEDEEAVASGMHRQPPAPLPKLQVSAAQDSFTLLSIASTSEASATPLDAREAAVPPATPHQKEEGVHSSASLMPQTGLPSSRVSSTQPPQSAGRGVREHVDESAARTPPGTDLLPIPSLSVPSAASTALPSPSPVDSRTAGRCDDV